MYTKCMCIPHFNKLLCIYILLVNQIKRPITAKFCTQNVYKFVKMCNTFRTHFAYI